MPSPASVVVVIGTGGTIAGKAARPQDHTGYTAGALTIDDLIAAVPALAAQALESESLAQIDSCDMDHATWQRLARAVQRQLARAEVVAVVITHGTDTLEETALFLHLTVAADKPVVLTAAMRPATALSPDGPQNLVDALTVARHSGARGVLAVMGGVVHGATDLRKVHGYRVDAFSSGDGGPLALVQNGQVRPLRAWPEAEPIDAAALAADPSAWPVVDIDSRGVGGRWCTRHRVGGHWQRQRACSAAGCGTAGHAAGRARGAGLALCQRWCRGHTRRGIARHRRSHARTSPRGPDA
jgi:L-asparaginase